MMTNAIVAAIDTWEKPGSVLNVMESLNIPYNLHNKKRINRCLYSLYNQGSLLKSQLDPFKKPLWYLRLTPDRLIKGIEEAQCIEEKLLKFQAKYNYQEVVIQNLKNNDEHHFELNYSSWFEGIYSDHKSEYGLAENTHTFGKMMLANWEGLIMIGLDTQRIYYLGRDYTKVECMAENIKDFVYGKWIF